MNFIKLLAVLLLVSCGSKKKDDPTPSVMITDEQIAQLQELNSTITWAPKCAQGIACHADTDGDSMLWAGLLCGVGYMDQCDAVRLSQKDSGQLCRSPSRCDQEVNAFSRDMLLGKLVSLTVSKDKDSASRMYSYIKANGYMLCPVAVDNRCDVSPTTHSAMWGTMKRVWQYIGLNPTNEMIAGDIGDETIIKLESQFTIGNGYELHLNAVEIFLRQRMSVLSDKLQTAAEIIASRQPNNPFYEYVAHGKTAKAAALVLEKCPNSMPEKPVQWAWQRDEKEQAWLDSNGWDCKFMITVLTQ